MVFKRHNNIHRLAKPIVTTTVNWDTTHREK